MRMGEIDIHDYARQLLEAHGEMAVVEAAQKARSFEETGETDDITTVVSIGSPFSPLSATGPFTM